MCGRFNQRLTPQQWAEICDILRMPQIEYEKLHTRYNAAPTQRILGIRAAADGPELVPLQWKLIPSWSKTPTIRFNTINAKSETVDTSGTYKVPFRRKRCLIPAAGFYEWPKPDSDAFDDKKPFYVYRDQGRPMCFAGLWDRWSKEGEPFESCTIITTPANAMMSEFHDRMPVILESEHWPIWLDTEIEDAESLKSLLQPFGEEDLLKHRVDKRVNNWRYNEADCFEPEDAST